MTEKEYRAHPAISRSELWRISESPEKFKYYRENPPEPTPALLFGQLFHKMALQPETVWNEFAVEPTCDQRTKDGKERWKQFQAKSEGKAVVTMEMVEQASEMCRALHENDYCRRLLSGERESPYFWTDEMTGVACKCRCDVVTQISEIPIIVDLKSTINAGTDSFMRESIRHGYHLQAAMYKDGVDKVSGIGHGFVFIAIEKAPPHSINILQADGAFLTYGYDVFRELIGTYHYCSKSGDWYGYMGRSNMVNNLSLPAWLAKEVE